MIKSYIQAARLRTLPLSISGIIVGSFLGFKQFFITQEFNFTFTEKLVYVLQQPVFQLSILTTIFFQVLSNFANDYGDGVKGTDANRLGESRMVANGLIKPSQMKNAMIVFAILSLLSSITLIYVAFGKDNFFYSLFFLGLGMLSIIAAIKYTVGKNAYGYVGFGDLFVFVFFGIVSVIGTYFLITKNIDLIMFLPSFSIGLLSTAVLNLNNMRDIHTDTLANKETLVVKIGAEFAKYYHYYLLGASLLSLVMFVIMFYSSIYQFLFLIGYIPLFKHLLFVIKNKDPEKYDGQLKVVALSTFLIATLLSVSQL